LAPTGITQKINTQKDFRPQPEKLRKERLRKEILRKERIIKESLNSGLVSVESYGNRLASSYMHRPGAPSLAYLRLA
jgi:hypothetical protein